MAFPQKTIHDHHSVPRQRIADRRISPSAPAPASSSTTAASSSSSSSCLSTNLETASSSSYFLPELIPLIASRLTSLQDFFALRAACRTYRDLLPPWPSNLASQGPLLLVPHQTSASDALLHVPLRRLHCFRLPRTRRDRRDFNIASFHSFGCRVAIHDRYYGRFSRHELHIRHLLTGERARLPDPPEGFESVIFSGNLVLTFTPWHGLLYYCRIGDASWQKACCDQGYQLRSLIFVKDTLYALIYPNYRLAIVELENNSVVLSFIGEKLSANIVQECLSFWLAECHGELLLVAPVTYYPGDYRVFRWQSGQIRNWVRTTSLGGCSLFFNINQFAGCLGPDHPAVRRDCLYFTSNCGRWSEHSLVDGSWHQHVVDYPGRSATTMDYRALTWVLPSIG